MTDESPFTAGPARMADNFEIELPEPRTLDLKTSEIFGAYSRRIYHLLGKLFNRMHVLGGFAVVHFEYCVRHVRIGQRLLQ